MIGRLPETNTCCKGLRSLLSVGRIEFRPGRIEILNPGSIDRNMFTTVTKNRQIPIYYQDDWKVPVDFVVLIVKQEPEHANH